MIRSISDCKKLKGNDIHDIVDLYFQKSEQCNDIHELRGVWNFRSKSRRGGEGSAADL